jgi:hypothetical protein
MSAKILPFPSPDPHIQGPAACVACRHQWQAVCPLGVIVDLECPRCHAPQGVITHLHDEQISDGYHSFAELYQHRCALFLALCRALDMGWKSHLHADGSSYPGWFIAGLMLPMFGEITYHLPNAEWDTTPFLAVYSHAPSWDGHTSTDVVARLRQYAACETLPWP